jgi:hypothetical protein
MLRARAQWPDRRGRPADPRGARDLAADLSTEMPRGRLAGVVIL